MILADVIYDLTPKIVAYALGQVVPYPLPDETMDVCSNLGTSQCPLDSTEEATWYFLFAVGHEYPLISLTLEATLYDQSNNTIGCFSLDAQIVE